MRKLIALALATLVGATAAATHAATFDEASGPIVVARRGADDPSNDARRGRGSDDAKGTATRDDRRGRGEGEARRKRDDSAPRGENETRGREPNDRRGDDDGANHG